MSTRSQIRVRGLVQGVGFRPFVFLHAVERDLKGRVFNNSMGVLIDVEGESEAIRRLVEDIASNPPPLARVERIEVSENLPPADFTDFRIAPSAADGKTALPVSPDAATCAACLKEMLDPADRRHRYPFINCVHCGPRFTIVEEMPYDRASTTMRDFPMCSRCRAEYLEPRDRRFHAEPIACPDCGPRLRLMTAMGEDLDSRFRGNDERNEDAVRRTLDLLAAGKIVAIKGIGGFHLACDALNRAAVESLRLRKRREEKPFALMAPTVEIVRRFCAVSAAEEALLLSPARPIVLLEKRPDAPLPAAVAPGVATLGFMLPYAPLHHLLFENLERPLVMTSGNLSDEPIAYRDADAVERLGGIADSFLLHDRRIRTRADDSVARVWAGRTLLARRSRGYAPEPIRTAFRFRRHVLACGAHLKNTFCLAKERYAFLSHHIGDLENFETWSSFVEGIERFERLFEIEPEAAAHDLHPGYLSTRYAMSLEKPVRIPVQHHHAHVASCMAEHGLAGTVIGVAFDGAGLGDDGTIWGGEFLVANFARFERRAHFRKVPLPGGDAAVRQPWRMALSYLEDLGADPIALELPGWQAADAKKIRLIQSMLHQRLNTVETSSCGRLFDAVSAILGLRHEASYEGQAAIELEHLAFVEVEEAYPFDLGGGPVQEIDFRRAIRAIVEDARAGRPAGWISARFHNTIAAVVVEVCRRLRAAEGLGRVCLSGGVFQNMRLLERACAGLGRHGFEVFHQTRVPTNDGGIALGQAAIANERIGRGG